MGSVTCNCSHQGGHGCSHRWVQSARSRYNTEFPVWHHSPGWSASYLVADWLSWTAPIMEREKLYSFCNRQSGYRFSLLLPKLLSMNLQNALFVIMLFHIALLLIKGLSSRQIKSGLIHLDYHVLLLPPNWASEYQAPALAPTLNSHYLWSDLSVYLPGYLLPASRLCVTKACPHAGTPSVTPYWFSWIPTPACQDCLLLSPSSFSLNNKPTSVAGLSPISWNEFQLQQSLSCWLFSCL